jgi:large subunit ribosomal protein L18
VHGSHEILKAIKQFLSQVNIWETVMYCTATAAVIVYLYVTRNVGRIPEHRRLELEHILLFMMQAGLFLYILFQIIGAYFSLDMAPRWSIMRIVTPVAALVQSMSQTILVLDAWKRRCDTKEQAEQKPGKQLVTFLLIANLAMWVVNRLKNNRAEFHPLQTEFYGVWAWTIITHTSMPLVVCYRFQSTVCLYEIWKHVYKMRPGDPYTAHSSN